MKSVFKTLKTIIKTLKSVFKPLKSVFKTLKCSQYKFIFVQHITVHVVSLISNHRFWHMYIFA